MSTPAFPVPMTSIGAGFQNVEHAGLSRRDYVLITLTAAYVSKGDHYADAIERAIFATERLLPVLEQPK